MNSDGTDRVFNSDIELQAAIEDAVAPVAQDLNGGGRMTDDDVARGSVSMLGFDHKRLFSKFKASGGKAAVLKHLDNQIASGPEKAGQDISIASGVKLPKGAHVVFNPPEELGVHDNPVPTAQDSFAKIGMTQKGPKAPSTQDDVRRALKVAEDIGKPPAGNTLPDLPDELDGKEGVIERLKTAGHSVHNEELKAASMKAIDAWQAKQKDPKLAKEQAAQARLSIEVIAEDAQVDHAKVQKLVAEAALVGGDKREEYIKNRAERYAINLSTADILELAAEAEKEAERRNPLEGIK